MSDPYRFCGARVVSIVNVADPHLAALVYHSHLDDDGRPLFGTNYDANAPGAVTLKDAEAALFGGKDGGGGGGSSSQVHDPGDVDGFLRASGTDESRSGLAFDRDSEQVFELRERALAVRAECVVEVELAEQRDERAADFVRQDAARGAAAADDAADDVGDDFDYDSDDAAAPVARAPSPVPSASAPSVRKRFIVQGLFPALSPGIVLDIAARPFTNNAAARARGALQRFDALQKECGIVPAARARVSLRDVRAVLEHGARMHHAATAAVLRRMFPRAFGVPVPADGGAARALDRALCGPRGTARLSVREPLANTVSVDALRDAFVRRRWPLSLITLQPDKRAVFSLAVLILYPDDVRVLVRAYGRRHWPALVARGAELVERTAELARTAPHVLAVDLLKYRAALAARQELEQRALAALRADGTSAQRYWERAAHATRQLAALPELSWTAFARLCRGHTAAAPPFAGIDIYKNVLLADLGGGGRGFDQGEHVRRARATARGATSNHMFTVLGDGAERLDDDHYDAAHADGTFCLDDWTEPDAAATDSGVDNEPTADGRLTVRPYAPEPPAGEPAARATLRDARRRCASEPTDDEFVAGMRWLLDEKVMHREVRRGTGPLNEGQRFDVYYTADMWRTQKSLALAIGDIYERGLRARLHANVALDGAARQQHARAFDEWRAVRHTARRQLLSLHYARLSGAKQAQKRKRGAGADADADADAQADPYEQVCALRDALRKEHVRARAALDRCAPLASPDPYANRARSADDLLARQRLVQRVDPLAEYERDDGVDLTDEQRDAVRHALLNPITIFMSPGGCGKTATARTVVDAYSRDQVLLVAQTAKAKLVLEERVGPASTIHSVLLREVLYRQAAKRGERRAKRVARRQRAAAADDRETSAARAAAARDLAFDAAFVECERLLGGVAEARSPFDGVRVLLIDELSLVDAELLCRLLAFAAPHIEKLIVLGDVDQLGSIGAGAVLRDLCHALPHCVKLFTRNFRSDGRAIFALARDIVLRRPREPDFDVERNAARLATPTSYRVDLLRDSSADIEARVARAEDASLVFVRAARHALGGALERTLTALGTVRPGVADVSALPPAERDAIFAARERTHIIAPTNKLVGECNAVCRALYHGRADALASLWDAAGAGASRELDARYRGRLLRHDKMFFRANFRDTYAVRETAVAEALENHPTEVTDDELAADDVNAQCAALATDAGIEAANRVDEYVELHAGAVPGGARRSRQFRVPWYNSEILTVVDFYNTAIKPRAQDHCVCGACAPADAAAARQLCVLLPHRVPPGRRALRWAAGPRAYAGGIDCHDARMANVGGTAQSAEFRRMVVLRTQAGAYKHVSVEARLGDRSAFDFAFATTVHRYQGSGVDTVILVLPYDSDFNDRLLAYTAVTRAAKRFIVIGEPHAWRAACARTPATRRSELWLEVARAAQRAHATLSAELRTPLADALGVGDALERELLALDAAALDADVPRLWRYFSRMRRAALERAQLDEL